MWGQVAARAGDWLVVESGFDSTHARTAEILAVAGPDGAPPYRVRWTDDDREALVFPGPDAHVVAAEEAARRAEASDERIARFQRAVREGVDRDEPPAR